MLVDNDVRPNDVVDFQLEWRDSEAFRPGQDRLCQILKALVAGQQNDDALALLDYMSDKGILADAKMYTLILTPHNHNNANNHSLHHVQQIHAHIRNNTTLEINDPLSAALITAYSRAGSLQDALSTFNELSKSKGDSSRQHGNWAAEWWR